jgi:hypothetical protein
VTKKVGIKDQSIFLKVYFKFKENFKACKYYSFSLNLKEERKEGLYETIQANKINFIPITLGLIKTCKVTMHDDA